MKSYWMTLDHDHATLEVREVPMPVPGGSQVLVKVFAAGLNRGEFIAGHGLHGKPGSAKAIGMECAGEVVQVGAAVTGVRVGDRVMGRCPAAFSTYALLDAREVMAVPERLSWQEAGSIPLTGHVVYDVLVAQGRLSAGEWVLINGVSSGVGVMALQTAKALGAKVIGTSGSAAKLARLAPLGLDLALPTRAADFCDAVLSVTGGQGVNLAINTVGGTVFAADVRCLAFEGRLATVGYVDGVLSAPIDLEALHARRLTLFGVSNKMRTPEQRAAGVPGFVRDVLPLIASGAITPLIDRVFAFDQLAAAKACMDGNEHVGKIVLNMAGAH